MQKFNILTVIIITADMTDILFCGSHKSATSSYRSQANKGVGFRWMGSAKCTQSLSEFGVSEAG